MAASLVFPVRRLAPDGLETRAQVVERGHEGSVAKEEACPRVGGARSPKVARLVGTNGLRSYPWHWVLQQQIKAGIAPSEGLIAAAERARREWDAR